MSVFATVLLSLSLSTDSLPAVAEAKIASETPVWVSARKALDEEGNLRPEFFHRTAVKRLVENARRNRRDAAPSAQAAGGGECQSFTGRALEQFGSTRTLDDLVRNSEVIVAGELVAAEQVFLFDSAERRSRPKRFPGPAVLRQAGERR